MKFDTIRVPEKNAWSTPALSTRGCPGTGSAETSPQRSQRRRPERLDAGLLRSPQSAAVESDRRVKPIWCAGPARRSSRWMAQSLRSGVSPKALVVPEGPPRRPVETTRVLIAVRGPAPTASGANSVASALGSLARRDPNETVRTYHEGS
jgi:hypothetical protein